MQQKGSFVAAALTVNGIVQEGVMGVHSAGEVWSAIALYGMEKL